MTEEASDGGTQSHSPPLHTTPSANGESSGYGGVYAFDSSLNYRRGTVPASSLEERGFGNVDLSTLPMEYLEVSIHTVIGECDDGLRRRGG